MIVNVVLVVIPPIFLVSDIEDHMPGCSGITESNKAKSTEDVTEKKRSKSSFLEAGWLVKSKRFFKTSK